MLGCHDERAHKPYTDNTQQLANPKYVQPRAQNIFTISCTKKVSGGSSNEICISNLGISYQWWFFIDLCQKMHISEIWQMSSLQSTLGRNCDATNEEGTCHISIDVKDQKVTNLHATQYGPHLQALRATILDVEKKSKGNLYKIIDYY